MKCYVGRHEHLPEGVRVVPCHLVTACAHPRDFAAILADARAACPAVNVWTNNPYLADCFDPADVLVCAAGPDGRGLRKPLATHPQFAKWAGAMKAGEMWSMFGEAWVLEESA